MCTNVWTAVFSQKTISQIKQKTKVYLLQWFLSLDFKFSEDVPLNSQKQPYELMKKKLVTNTVGINPKFF